ncbi:alpha/beta hydrolase [Pantoea ananatis]|uniref:alpha/beta hydrolase n=1 Tax=Pantoea ananas TaxID=553 RepID=UPI0024AE072F|nr:alpha/beta hydrolase [Pantoea ananatis]MDI6539863.1 alpha/beta hydrolase [Pantoea ananatis]
MNRRVFLMSFTAGLVVAGLKPAFASQKHITSVIPLWQGTPPGKGGPTGPVITSTSGAQTNISSPFLTVSYPDKPNRKAVIVAAGGGYKRIETGKEALPAAAWLNQHGYTAYILTYRLPAEGWDDKDIVAIQDAQRALRIVRSREKHVSVLGFSAGGHLMGMAACRSDFKSYAPRDELDLLEPITDSAALIYPVITLEKPYTHTSVHKILAGPHASEEADARLSVQTYVTPQSPPFFLIQADDDPVSDPHNTLIMNAVCEQERVSVEMHRFTTGGHGFGMGKPGTPTIEWPSYYDSWLKTEWRM